MSHLTYTNYKGWGERAAKNFHYSSAVRIGDTIELSGQGGWTNTDFTYPDSLSDELTNAFANVERALRAAGAPGWAAVYKIRSYHTPPLEWAVVENMVELIKKNCPDHEPLWTCIGVAALADPKMRVEIEVKAHVPPGK